MRLDRQLAKYYYTAAQARKILGLDEEAFQYWIRKGRIKRITLPGRAQGVYSKREVHDIANKIEAMMLVEQPEGTEFRKATPNDLEQEYQLAHLVFGEKAESRNERRAFLLKNPDIDYHVYDQDKLVAYIIIVPLKHETLLDFIEGRIKISWTINPDAIEQFTPEKPLECLLVDMVTTPTVPPIKRASYGVRLLLGLENALVEMGRQGIQITKLYATSRTPSGIRILKNAGFQIIHDHEDGRFSFELDIMNSDEEMLREYQETVKELRKQQGNMLNKAPSKSKKASS